MIAATTLLQQLLHLHRIVRIGSASTKEILTAFEASLLGEFFPDSVLTVGRCAELLGVSKSNISVQLRAFEQRGLLIRQRSSAQRGSAGYRASAEGIRLIEIDDALRSRITREFLKCLSRGEQHVISKLLHQLADGLGALPISPRHIEHPFRAVQRRLTRALGLHRRTFIFSDIHITGLHILLLCDLWGTLSQRDLRLLIPYDQSTISRALRSLKKLNYLAIEEAAEDKRQIRCQLTVKAQDALASLRSQFAKAARTTLNKYELARGVNLMSKVLQAGELQSARNNFRLNCKEVTQDADRRQSRAFYVSALTREGLLEKLEGELFPNYQRVFISTPQQAQRFACGMQVHGGSTALCTVALPYDRCSDVEVLKFLEAVVGHVAPTRLPVSISVREPLVSARLKKVLAARQISALIVTAE